MSFTARPSRTYTSNRTTAAAAAAARTEQQQQQQQHQAVEGTGQMLGTFDDSSTIAAATNNAVLSQEEMRARRLATLSGTSCFLSRSMTQQNQLSSSSLSSTRQRSHPRNNDVIDLCSSSDEDDDDDDNDNVTTKPAARPATQRAPTIPRPPRRVADLGTRTLPIAFDMSTIPEDSDSARRSSSSSNRASAAAAAARRDNSNDSSSAFLAATKRQKRNPLSPSQNTLPQTEQTTRVIANDSNTFRVCTYNLWFEPIEQPARMQAISEILLQQQQANINSNNNLWLVGFQEVTDSLAVQLFPRLERAGYTVVRQPNAPYGCAIAVYTRHLDLLDAAFEPYSFSRMGRGILHARVRCPISQKQILFCTTHLESWGGPHMLGSDERQEQVLELEAFCQEQIGQYRIQTVILTGDWNWDDVRPRSKGPDPVLLDHLRKFAWKDAWLSLHSKDLGYTYDGKESPMLLNQLRRRFDRVLVHSSSNTSILSADLVGKTAISGLEWDKPVGNEGRTRRVSVLPSDHYGLVVQLQMEGK